MPPDGVTLSDGGLTDANGMTLYTYDNDTQPGESACTGRCLTNWPIVSVAGDVALTGDLTVITRDDGLKQWAYKGKPLYTFAHDDPGDATGDDLGKVWHKAVP